MARVEDLEGRKREGTYVDPDGMRTLMRELKRALSELDDMASTGGDNGSAAARFGKDDRVAGARYVGYRNTLMLTETRTTVGKIASSLRLLMDNADRVLDGHEGADGAGRDHIRNAGG